MHSPWRQATGRPVASTPENLLEQEQSLPKFVRAHTQTYMAQVCVLWTNR